MRLVYQQHSRLAASFNHPVGAQNELLRNGETERLGSFSIDEELHLGGLLDRQFAGLRALQYSVHVVGRAPEVACPFHAVTQ